MERNLRKERVGLVVSNKMDKTLSCFHKTERFIFSDVIAGFTTDIPGLELESQYAHSWV